MPFLSAPIAVRSEMFSEAKLRKVENEIKRFMSASDAHRVRMNNDDHYAKYWYITGSPETSAIKRASMDLTRALADLRR